MHKLLLGRALCQIYTINPIQCVIVLCLYMCTEKVCTPGDIKLVDGGVDYEGRVEYCNDGIWGTVCDDRWSAEDAAVVCAMLGHPREGECSISFVFLFVFL